MDVLDDVPVAQLRTMLRLSVKAVEGLRQENQRLTTALATAEVRASALQAALDGIADAWRQHDDAMLMDLILDATGE